LPYLIMVPNMGPPSNEKATALTPMPVP
jgi:hypothetical protein